MSELILLRKKFCLLVPSFLVFFFIVCFLKRQSTCKLWLRYNYRCQTEVSSIYKPCQVSSHLLLFDVCRLHPNQSESCYLFAIKMEHLIASTAFLVQIMNVVPFTLSKSPAFEYFYNLWQYKEMDFEPKQPIAGAGSCKGSKTRVDPG